MIFTHGVSALRLREKHYDYRITLEAYFPDYSSQCSHPLGSSGFIIMLDREVSLKKTFPSFSI